MLSKYNDNSFFVLFFVLVYFQCFNPAQSRLPPNDGYLCAKCSAKCCKWFHVLCGQEPEPPKDENNLYEFDDIAMVDDDGDSDWAEEGEEDSEEEGGSDDEAEEIEGEEEDADDYVVVL